MHKWEYKSVIISPAELNKLGEEGWELVSVTPERKTRDTGFMHIQTETLLRYHLKRLLVKEDSELLNE
jgi:hypothetical protein